MTVHSASIVTTEYRQRCAAPLIAACLLVGLVAPASALSDHTSTQDPAVSTEQIGTSWQRAPRSAAISRGASAIDEINRSTLHRRGGISAGIMVIFASLTMTVAVAARRRASFIQRLPSRVI